jgi:hypothetical protein
MSRSEVEVEVARPERSLMPSRALPSREPVERAFRWIVDERARLELVRQPDRVAS